MEPRLNRRKDSHVAVRIINVIRNLIHFVRIHPISTYAYSQFAAVDSYSPRGANVPFNEMTLAPPGEYD